jgi:hypothetical protein
MIDENKPPLTTEEVANLLQVERSTVFRRAARLGVEPVYGLGRSGLGRRALWSKDAVERLSVRPPIGRPKGNAGVTQV